MIQILLISLIVLMVLTVIYNYSKKPCIHKVDHLDKILEYIEVLLDRGNNGGFLVIKLDKSSLFVQLSKYEGKISGVQLDFPKVEWSIGYYDKLKAMLDTCEIRYRIESAESEDLLEFISIDFGADSVSAANLVKKIFKDVFNVNEEIQLSLHFGNVRVE